MENHDNPRAKELIKDRRRLINFTAFMMFLKGAYLFYNGQETMSDHTPSLFDKDLIEWEIDNEIVELTKALNQIKKMDFMREGNLFLKSLTADTAEINYEYKDNWYTGIFNIGINEESDKDILGKIDSDSELEILFNGADLINKDKIESESELLLPIIYKSKRKKKDETGIIS